jgi:GNAT superfamily N-acetyltransferase
VIGIRRARLDEVPALADLISRAVRGDPILAWIFPGAPVEGRIRRFFEAFDRAAAERGWLWTAGRGAALAVWTPPSSDDAYAEVENAARPAMLEETGDGGARYEAFWAWTDSHRPTEPHWHLDHLAVEPGRQGEGLGLALVEFGLALARRDGVPAFLETGRERNIGFYERLGFAACDQGTAPDRGPRVWFMRWDPSGESAPGVHPDSTPGAIEPRAGG